MKTKRQILKKKVARIQPVNSLPKKPGKFDAKKFLRLAKKINLKNTSPEMKPLFEWEKEFDDEVSRLRRDLGTETIYKFGYKHRIGNELFTVTDWGNVKSFIRSLLSSENKRAREEVINHWERAIFYSEEDKDIKGYYLNKKVMLRHLKALKKSLEKEDGTRRYCTTKNFKDLIGWVAE